MAALVDPAVTGRKGFETLLALGGFGLAAMSPDGRWFAVATAGRVAVRSIVDGEPERVTQMLQCVDKVDKLEFSPDSGYLLCALYSRQAIQVFSMTDPTWKCRINESAAGLISAMWAPDSRTILTESDFGIQMSLWSLTDSSQAVISLPKPAQRQLKSQFAAFSECKRFLAVVHRIEMQDMIGVYSLAPPAEMVKFKARSGDVNAVSWLPGGAHIVTLDSPLTYKCCVYTPSGDMVLAYEAYQGALGIRQLAVTPLAGQFSSHGSWLALGSFDSKVRLLSLYSWQLAFTLPLAHIKDTDFSLLVPNVVTTVEVAADDVASTEWDGQTAMLAPPATGGSVFVTKMLKTLPKSATDPKAAIASASASAKASITAGGSSSLPQFGVSWLAFSPQGDFLAATEDTMPRCLWVYRTADMKLCALVVFQQAVTSAQWRPGSAEAFLAISTGAASAYFWSPQHGPQRVDRRGCFSAQSAKWCETGALLLLRGKDNSALCRITDSS